MTGSLPVEKTVITTVQSAFRFIRLQPLHIRDWDRAPVMITREGNRSYGRCISVQLVAGEGFELCCGDKIAFYGNRIVCRTDWPHNDSIKYIYSTFQACPMTQEEQESIHLMAEGWMVDEY